MQALYLCKKNIQKFKIGTNIHKGIRDYIHSHVWGPSPKVYFGGLSYFVKFIDYYSRKVWIYLLKRKSDVFNAFKHFRAWVQKNTGRSIKCLRIDNGSDFTSKEFENYYKESRIERKKTTAYTPQQHDIVEHMNMTLLERARSILSNAKL
jgi:transposase InsO family protein